MKKDRNQKQYIFVCQGKDCLKNGARQLQRDIEKLLKQRKRCQLIKTRCMDRCKDGPSLVIDDVWYGKVTDSDLDEVLNKKAAK